MTVAGGKHASGDWRRDEPYVGRNAVLIAVALAGTMPAAERPLGWIDAVTVLGVVAFAALAWVAVDGLVANLPALDRARA